MSKDNDFIKLQQQIKAAGLLERHPVRYYAPRTIALTFLLATSITTMAVADHMAIHLANAVLLSVIFVQLCFLGHDLGHKQVFQKSRNNDIGGIIVSAILGINRSWWVEKHNQHHANPNHLDLDPDINMPYLAFDEGDAKQRPALARAVIRYQAFFFYPMTCAESIVLKTSGLGYLISRGKGDSPKMRFPTAERMALAFHVVAYFGLAFTLMPPLTAALFVVIHQAITGIYVSATFAPNHKGMEVLDSNNSMNFLESQVLTARNVTPNPINDYLYGGLNYQIEHHLFPNMPRNCLKKAREIVRPFCRAQGVPYYETGPFRSQREILQHLHNVGAPLRARSAPRLI